MAISYRADHIGSLLRPPELLQARTDLAAGKITRDQLRDIEDASILSALDLQKQAGIEIFTDGEYRRETFLDPLGQGIDGLTSQEALPDARGRFWQGPHCSVANAAMAQVGTFLTQVAAGKLRRTGRLTGIEASFLAKHSPGDWKITMPGPMLRAQQMYRPGITDAAYASVGELGRAMASIMVEEVQDLAKEGVTYLQLDSLLYVRPIEARELAEIIDADNLVLDAAKQAGLTVGLHMCRGNNRSSWLSEGSYEPCAEQAFNNLHADRFLLEYDTERAGGFEPLRFMPRDKVVILGLVSSKEPPLESQDVLRRRIDEAAKYVPFENLGLSPQCGFASSMLGNLLTWDDQRRKLELVVDTTRKVWG